VKVDGYGLFGGKPVEVLLHPAKEGEGISFDTPKGTLRAEVSALQEKARYTSLSNGSVEVNLSEHLLAALYGLHIRNVRVQISADELPILDGSALPWITAIKEAGLVEQEQEWRVFHPPAPIVCAEGNRFLALFPGEKLRIGYFLDYSHPAVGRDFLLCPVDEERFCTEIAPARTFITEEELLEVQKSGQLRHLTGSEGILFQKSGPHTPLRSPHEPAQHKILDILGDLAVAGLWVQGTLLGIRSGHRLNHLLTRQILKEAHHAY